MPQSKRACSLSLSFSNPIARLLTAVSTALAVNSQLRLKGPSARQTASGVWAQQIEEASEKAA